MQADYLYFRDPDTVGEDIPKLLRLSLISMALGYFDHALMILERPQIAKYLKNNFQISPMDIAFTASKIYGRKSFFDAFYRRDGATSTRS